MRTINPHFEVEVSEDQVVVVDLWGGHYHSLYLAQPLPIETRDAFATSVCNHVYHVRQAGEWLGVLRPQLESHDFTKFTLAEFPHYAQQFHGDKADPNGFAVAWLHHVHHNPHHWQHWCFPDQYELKGSNLENGRIPMPEHYVLEMVADWMGASQAYTGSMDMTKWLLINLPKLQLHSETWKTLNTILIDLGYQPHYLRKL